MANGGPIEPWWQMYPFHKAEAVYNLLSKYKIGELHVDDRVDPDKLPDFTEMQT